MKLLIVFSSLFSKIANLHILVPDKFKFTKLLFNFSKLFSTIIPSNTTENKPVSCIFFRI